MTVKAGRRLGGLVAGVLAIGAALVAGLVTGPGGAGAASHREAPLIAMDPGADITDFYFFRSYEPGKSSNVVMVMDVIPGEEPSSGPNYYFFDPSVTYSFSIDNDRDGKADDVEIDLRFQTEIRGLTKALGLPLSFIGGLEPDADPTIPRIDSLDHPGIGLRQTYTVTMKRKHQRPVELASGIVAPPRVGPRTTGTEAQYEALAQQAVVSIPGGGRVWAGPRDDPFAIDLGAVFDSLNLRSLTDTDGVDMLSGFNVHSIVLELPASLISNGSNILGAYASTSRPFLTVGGEGKGPKTIQVQRLANPLINEVIIGVPDKDKWNATEPEDDAQFEGYYLKPRVALALQLATTNTVATSCLLPSVPGCAPQTPTLSGTDLAPFNRTDLVALLLQYNGILYGDGNGGRNSDLLRLNFG
ncbi:MAG: DUF4331 domain-containing protein, partial [Actinobacteria bacterium]|nr:DUF4331 domain-containing protein [Actinomycetota bacterium]